MKNNIDDLLGQSTAGNRPLAVSGLTLIALCLEIVAWASNSRKSMARCKGMLV